MDTMYYRIVHSISHITLLILLYYYERGVMSMSMSVYSTSILEYAKYKISVLRQLHIKLTDIQEQKFFALPSEIAMDNYAHSIIMHS